MMCFLVSCLGGGGGGGGEAVFHVHSHYLFPTPSMPFDASTSSHFSPLKMYDLHTARYYLLILPRLDPTAIHTHEHTPTVGNRRVLSRRHVPKSPH